MVTYPTYAMFPPGVTEFVEVSGRAGIDVFIPTM
jgi:hypothetical protein